jgi:signal transduction histidine kinase
MALELHPLESMAANMGDKLLEAQQCLGCMHEGVVITSTDGIILDATIAAERILATPSLSLKGRNIRSFCRALDVYEDMLQQTATDKRCLNRSLIVDAGGKRKLVNMSLERVSEGADVRLVHVFQDCADLRTMEERLLQAERLATVGRFASQIAHEIRNPLSSISLNIELLEDELGEAGGEARGLIRSVLRELDRLNDIVSEYLQFSRFPKPHLKKGRVDAMIHELLGTWKPEVPVRVEVALMASSPEVWFDERLLRQVLENLTRNAAEAIEGEGVVRIETDVIDKFFVIRVKDTGRGIPPEIQTKLFEPFFTTKAHGTGLGLATSQQIIFEHNGHLLVESQPGKGSTFTTLLPL